MVAWGAEINMDLNAWLVKAKENANAKECGMYLIHNGVVRETSRKEVRQGVITAPVKAINFSYNKELLEKIVNETKNDNGIKYVDVYLNEGILNVGDDLMYVLVGGDIRDNVLNSMNSLLKRIKTECVKEEEILEKE